MDFKRWISYAAGSLLLVLTAVGCHIIAAYEAGDVSYPHYECSTELVNCVPKPPPSLGVTVRTPSPSGVCYTEQPGIEVGDPHHCTQSGPAAPGVFRNSVFADLGHPALHGASQIVTRVQDQAETAAKFLEASWTGEVEEVFVAYDARVQPPPTWLSTDYLQLTDAQGQPAVMAVTDANPGGRRELHLYRRTSVQPSVKSLELPGNLTGFPQGPPTPTPVMYMVLLQPVDQPDCSDPGSKVIGTFKNAACGFGKSESEVEADHAAECESIHGATLCGTTTCTPKGSCPGLEMMRKYVAGLTAKPFSYDRHSEIEFDPTAYTARALIQIDGDRYTRDVTGKLDFEYEIDSFGRMWLMRLNSMFLDIPAIRHRGVSFDDIVIGLLAPVPASCAVGQNPPWATPCSKYHVPKDAMTAKMSFTAGDAEPVFVAQNSHPFDIGIDHTNRTFHFQGGPLVTNTVIDGERVTIQVSLDLYGHFLDFAPQAVASESMQFVECGGGPDMPSSNLAPVDLDASASFEIYGDPIPASAHQWYEDWTLITQRRWGTGPKVTIPKHQLAFGVHTMSLLIFDPLGGVDEDTFEIEVRDSIPPTLQIPADVFFLPDSPGPVTIDLGEALASDICSTDVVVVNDAPPGSTFPPGTTAVTWTADDGRGHATQAVQHVHVFTAPSGGGLVALTGWVAEVTANLAKASAKGAKSLAECEPARPCSFALDGMAGALDASLERLSVLAAAEASPAELAEVVESLEGVRTEWTEVAATIEQVPTMRLEGRALLADAATSLDAAAATLAEASERLERLSGGGSAER